MKNSKKVALSAGALMLSALSFTTDAQAVNNSSNLLSFRNLGTGSEMRSELFNANNPIESAKNFEATCGEKGKEGTTSTDKTKEAKCGEKGKEAKCGEKGKEAKCGEKGKEAKCGEKGKEAKCGEKGKEAKCGEKGKEAKCGEKTPKK
ncbi:MAG: hypothetical protein V4667_05955 [Bacteroidota bacterium]